ncbi:uncharacterized protein [Temnothorax nylanderi]|uniref:uncharacterized protein n=1 Tax=Temnothorax nylanderi TaxID=102681 RepID=UPI003A8A26E5
MNVEETMWARVEYELDKQKADVPLSFFKDYEVVLSELQSCVTRSEYKVFWSVNQEETPKTVLKEQGQILDIEKIVCGKKKVPLTGYYKAKLLHYAESLSDLTALCEKPKGRRPVQPTMKTECKENKKKMTGKSKKNNCIEEARQYNLQRLSDDKCNQNLEKRKLRDKYIHFEIKDSKEAKLSNTVCSFRELSKEDDLICMDNASEDEHEEKIIKKQKTVSNNMEHIMHFQEELKEWKQKYTELEMKYKDLEDRYFKILDLNFKWQDKELSHHSSHRSSHKSESSKHKSAKHDSYKFKDCLKKHDNSHKSDNELSCSSKIPNYQKVKTELPDWQNDFDESSIILNEDLSVINDIDSKVTVLHIEQPIPQIPKVDTSLSSASKSQLKDSDHVSYVVDDIEKDELHNKNKTEIRPQLEGATSNKNYTLEGPAYNIDPSNGVSVVSQAQFDQINKVELGLKGDGKFVKKIADVLWTREELSKRSASGKACPNKANSKARKACSPDKKKYLSDLLQKRIYLEQKMLL